MTTTLFFLFVLHVLAAQPADDAPFDLVLAGGRIIDGTGNPWFSADVGIRGGRIVAVGNLDGRKATRTLEVTGLVVAPGFIDLHSHADGLDEDGLRSNDEKRRAAPNLVTQGVTTLVVNQDGGSPYSIEIQKQELEAKKFGPNAVLLVGHNTVRAMVMAENKSDPFADAEIARMQRLAKPEEIEAMRRLVIEGMEAGAYGMSAGLEYIPGRWSDTEEVVHADFAAMGLDRVKDAATFFEPHRYAEGMVHVLVGGVSVVENGQVTWALPGKVITPEEGRKPPALLPAATN